MQETNKPNFNEDDYLRQSTVDVATLKISESSKHDYEVIQKRINDYRDACQYMMSVVGDRKKAGEFLGVAEKLKVMQEAIQKGKRIDTLKIDPDVTPAVILGYSEEERQKKFNDIVKIYD